MARKGNVKWELCKTNGSPDGTTLTTNYVAERSDGKLVKKQVIRSASFRNDSGWKRVMKLAPDIIQVMSANDWTLRDWLLSRGWQDPASTAQTKA